MSNNTLAMFQPSLLDFPTTRTPKQSAPAERQAPLEILPLTRVLDIAPSGNRSLAYTIAKRVFDIAAGLVLLVLFSPVMLVTLLVLMVTTRGMPLFRQQRVGRCGREFTMLKFRTMHVDAVARQSAVVNEMDGPVFKNRRDPRITRLGRILRSTSIDELPQLLNVLAGHMSLVGPRPPIMKEVLQYEPWQQRRLAVKPGLTCLWQVSGRNEIGFEDWVRMDLWYIDHQNLLVDLKLLLLTPVSVLSRRGAY
ncbi:MAG TPA: sugar transferase [Pirellulales bacterium]|jgi:lipopolysaccharide/colanic/teichoic acid biosynthesis glycosyltransferase|nr:sugar transferase [Pirellulales bacterium]